MEIKFGPELVGIVRLYKVASESRPGKQHFQFVGKGFAGCTCEAFNYNPLRPCKHLDGVLTELTPEEYAELVPDPIKAPPVG